MRRFFLFILFLAFSFSAFGYTLLPAEKNVIITGYTRAVKTMTVTAETSGRLKEVKLGMGDMSDGGVFAVIDPVFTRYSIDSAEASMQKLDANIARVENNIAYLRKEYNRSETLYTNQADSERNRDTAKQALDQAELSLKELQAQKTSVKVQISELKEKLRRQYIHIPKGWRVTSKPLEKGELVSAGQSIATAGDFRTLIVPVYLSNDQLKYLRKKGTFEVTVDGKPEKARINRVNPAFDERTLKRHVELELDMEGLGGLVVRIPVTVPGDGLMVDKEAVSERYDNPKVRVKSTGKEIEVTVLGRDGDMVIIGDTSGLHAGMELEAVK